MNIIVTNAIKNIKNSVLLNIIMAIVSVVLLITSHKIMLSFVETYKNINNKYSKEYEVYKTGEDKDIFYFNDYENNDIKEEINTLYKNYGLKTVIKNITLPASLILRTLSEYVIVSAYDEYSMFSNTLVEGNIFTSTNNNAIISEYLPLKTNDIFQLFIRDSLSGYRARTFSVSGIYSTSNINANAESYYLDITNENVIYTSFNTITNFLYAVGSGKSPYFEHYILYFSDYKKIDSIINQFSIDGFIINSIKNNDDYDINNYTKIHLLFAIISVILACIFMIAALNYLQIQHRISLGYLREYKLLSKRSQFVQIFIIDFMAIPIYLIFLKIIYKKIDITSLLPICTLVLSSILSILLSIFRKYQHDENENINNKDTLV